MTSLRTLRVLIVVTAAACATASCGKSERLDGRKAEQQIGGVFSSDFGIPPPPVSCPSRPLAIKGARFDCTTTIEGEPVTIHVDVGEHVFLHFGFDKSIVRPSRVAELIEKDIEDRTKSTNVTVQCGSVRYIARAPGETMPCMVIGSGPDHLVTVTVVDASGKFDYEPKT